MELIEIIAGTAQIVGLLVVVGPTFRLVRTRSFLSFFFWIYALFAVWGTLFCLVLPLVAVRLTGDRGMMDYFPEGPVLAGILFAGWIYPGAIALIGTTIRSAVRGDGSVSGYF